MKPADDPQYTRARGGMIAFPLFFLLGALVLAMLALAGQARAASGDLAWPAIVFDSPTHGNDGFEGTAPAPRGGVYAVGAGGGPDRSMLAARYSAGGSRLWLRTFRSPAGLGGYLRPATTDRNGNLIAVGQLDGFKGVVAVKFGSGGQRKWLRVYNDPLSSAEYAADVGADADGNVYVAASADIGTSSFTVLLKYSPSGQRRWVRRYAGGGMSSGASDLAVDGGGNAYMTGQIQSSTAWDILTLKYDASGHLRWARRWAGTGPDSDSGNSIVVAGNGQAYVAGYTNSTATGDDAVILKYSSAGVLKWSRSQTSTGVQQDSYYDIAVLRNGDVAAAGVTAGHVLVARLSPTGATRWATASTDPDAITSYARSVGVGASGAIYVAGETSSATTSYDILTAKYSASGHFQWAKAYAGAGGFDQQVESSLTFNGGVYVTGFQESAATGADAALVKYLP